MVETDVGVEASAVVASAFALLMVGCTEGAEGSPSRDAGAHDDCREVPQSSAFRTPSSWVFEDDPVVLVPLDAVGDGCPSALDEVPPLTIDTVVPDCLDNQTATGCGVFTLRTYGGHQDCHYALATGELIAASVANDALSEIGGCLGVYFHGGRVLEACPDIEIECPERPDAGAPPDGGSSSAATSESSLVGAQP